MNELEQQVKSVQEKLQQLIRRYKQVQKENQRLTQELAGMKQHAGEQQQNMEQLIQQLEIVKLGSGMANEKDRKDFEKRINQYIREIDRCISLLSK